MFDTRLKKTQKGSWLYTGRVCQKDWRRHFNSGHVGER